MSNADTVRAIYESFGRGDVQGILDHMHPDVEWERWDETNTLQDAGYPPMQQRHGHDGVVAFLGAVQQTIELPVFELRAVFEDGDTVASRLQVRVRFKDSGNEIDDDEWHVWTFDGAGRVLAMRHLLDTKKHLDAWAG
ncbi:MAG: nuclear transport factor 2 family protein [Ilumatobacteraceae bacterium]